HSPYMRHVTPPQATPLAVEESLLPGAGRAPRLAVPLTAAAPDPARAAARIAIDPPLPEAAVARGDVPAFLAEPFDLDSPRGDRLWLHRGLDRPLAARVRLASPHDMSAGALGHEPPDEARPHLHRPDGVSWIPRCARKLTSPCPER